MPRAVILADDLTGALDSGVQLAAHGVKTVVHIDENNLSYKDPTADVLVVNTESRHLTAAAAAGKVAGIMRRARLHGMEYFYKKTDSVLRGNVASELCAAAAEGDDILYFTPAYPQAGRTTENGVHYLQGIPVDKTAFAADPFTPVRTARIADLFTDRGLCLKQMNPGQLTDENCDHGGRPAIVSFDAVTDADMRIIAQYLKINKAGKIAGCAGMAYYLPYIWDLPVYTGQMNVPAANLVIISGSVNPLTMAQIDYARQREFPVKTLSAEQKLDPNYFSSGASSQFLEELATICESRGKLIVEAVDSSGTGRSGLDGTDAVAERQIAAANIARLTASLMHCVPDAVFFIIGGDTLVSVLHRLQTGKVYPLAEITTGTVLSRLNDRDLGTMLISKSGGLGEVDALVRTEAMLKLMNQDNRGECP